MVMLSNNYTIVTHDIYVIFRMVTAFPMERIHFYKFEKKLTKRAFSSEFLNESKNYDDYLQLHSALFNTPNFIDYVIQRYYVTL